jgi:hypothetical protein
MDELVDHILPHFLPDKLAQPDMKQTNKKPKDEENQTP